MNLLFWLLWGVDLIIALIVIYFFFVGLFDGTVSSFNMGIWGGALLALAGIMLGSLWLKSSGHVGIAISVLCLMAVPGVLYGLFLLVAVTSKAKWY